MFANIAEEVEKVEVWLKTGAGAGEHDMKREDIVDSSVPNASLTQSKVNKTITSKLIKAVYLL